MAFSWSNEFTGSFKWAKGSLALLLPDVSLPTELVKPSNEFRLLRPLKYIEQIIRIEISFAIILNTYT